MTKEERKKIRKATECISNEKPDFKKFLMKDQHGVPVGLMMAEYAGAWVEYQAKKFFSDMLEDEPYIGCSHCEYLDLNAGAYPCNVCTHNYTSQFTLREDAFNE